MGRKKVLFTIIIFLLLSLACVTIFYARIATFMFARSNNIDISYRQAIAGSLTEFIFKDLKASWQHQSIGLSSSNASIKLVPDRSSPLRPLTDFVLNDVRFTRKGSGKEASYNNIDDLVAAPFSSLLKYRTVSGKIGMIKNGISLKDFLASGDEIRFLFNGTLTDSGVIDADITIYFARSLTEKIPPELSNMALKDEPDEWKSLTLKLQGDLSKPSIQVTGRLFRLNIGVKQ